MFPQKSLRRTNRQRDIWNYEVALKCEDNNLNVFTLRDLNGQLDKEKLILK